MDALIKCENVQEKLSHKQKQRQNLNLKRSRERRECRGRKRKMGKNGKKNVRESP